MLQGWKPPKWEMRLARLRQRGCQFIVSGGSWQGWGPGRLDRDVWGLRPLRPYGRVCPPPARPYRPCGGLPNGERAATPSAPSQPRLPFRALRGIPPNRGQPSPPCPASLVCHSKRPPRYPNRPGQPRHPTQTYQTCHSERQPRNPIRPGRPRLPSPSALAPSPERGALLHGRTDGCPRTVGIPRLPLGMTDTGVGGWQGSLMGAVGIPPQGRNDRQGGLGMARMVDGCGLGSSTAARNDRLKRFVVGGVVDGSGWDSSAAARNDRHGGWGHGKDG